MRLGFLFWRIHDIGGYMEGLELSSIEQFDAAKAAGFAPRAPRAPRADTAPEEVEILNAGPSPASLEMEADALRHVESAKLLEANVRLSGGQDVIQIAPPGRVLDTYAPASQADLDQLKEDINASFSELSNVLLDIQRGFEILNDRIAKYNERSSHKI
jgi:hypothetical protein